MSRKKTPLIIIGVAVIAIVGYLSRTNNPWQSIDTGLRFADFNEEVLIYEIDPRHFIFSVADSRKLKSLEEWREESDAIIAVNGGYFREDLTPAGALVVNGKMEFERAFDQNLSAAFLVEGEKPWIQNLAKYPINDFEEFDFAMQSYPLLMAESKKNIEKDSGKRARRTLISDDENGLIYFIILHKRAVSLFEAMEILMELPVTFKNVLNLDGGPSTGISVLGTSDKKMHANEIPSSTGVPNVLLVHTNAK